LSRKKSGTRGYEKACSSLSPLSCGGFGYLWQSFTLFYLPKGYLEQQEG
jgi:hypothetical protein